MLVMVPMVVIFQNHLKLLQNWKSECKTVQKKKQQCCGRMHPNTNKILNSFMKVIVCGFVPIMMDGSPQQSLFFFNLWKLKILKISFLPVLHCQFQFYCDFKIFEWNGIKGHFRQRKQR